MDSTLAQAQLKGLEEGSNKRHKLNVQELFSEAFLQLQQELQQESLAFTEGGSTTQNNAVMKKKNQRRAAPENDPLSILHDLSRSKKRRKAPPPPSSAQNTAANAARGGGGFLRPVPVPERLRKMQQAQAQKQAELIARMNRAAKADKYNHNKHEDTSKRRQPSRKSIWNSVMDNPKTSDKTNDTTSKSIKKRGVPNIIHHEIDLTVEGVTCTCESTNIDSAGNVTSRSDIVKGEVWGGKDRADDVILRYRCNECGKSWQESG